MPRRIDVEFYYTEDDPGRVGFVILAENGKIVSAQDILDAVAETLLYHYPYFDLETVPEYDG